MCHHTVPVENYDKAVIAEVREAHDEAELRAAYTEAEFEILGVAE
jgi:uncharacterized protein YutD